MNAVTTMTAHDLQAADDEMKRLLSLQQKAFLADMNPTLQVRLNRLDRLLRMTEAHAQEITAAISQDFGNRSPQQTLLAELLMVSAAIKHAKRHVGRWMRTRRAPIAMHYLPGHNRIMRQPLGVVGVIAPWNYPYQLAVGPAIGALAAGNRVMIKPSELTPNLAALIKNLVAQYFGEDEVTVITGNADTGKAFAELPFDHLVFTGSTRVGRLVAQAAAKNLTPVTLELGGKSPVIVDPSADIAMAASRIAHTKLFNCGQTCIAPDYVLLPAGRENEFVAAFKRAVTEMYPSLAHNPDYTCIINDQHYGRLQALVDDARDKGAQIVEINPAGEALAPAQRKMVPAIVLGGTEDMRIMQDEIFGPLLPIVSYSAMSEAIHYVNRRERPLALYWIGDDAKTRDRILQNTISGGVTINDCMWHFGQEDMPFGGVGASGCGAYHGEYGFRTFSKEKPVFYQPKLNGLRLLYPPYGKTFDRIVSVLKKIA